MIRPAWGPGHVVAQRYRLLEQLGQGGMGEVWRAEHGTLHAPVAIKLLDPQRLDPERGVTAEEVHARFLVEAQAAAALRSPHVVQVLDHGIDDGVPYLVLELLEGETLGDRLGRVPILPYEQTARILTHVARAITFLVRNDDEEMAPWRWSTTARG